MRYPFGSWRLALLVAVAAAAALFVGQHAVEVVSLLLIGCVVFLLVDNNGRRPHSLWRRQV